MTSEQMALELIARGSIIVSDDGTILRIGRSKKGVVSPYPEPRRIDHAGKDGYCRISLNYGRKVFIVYAHRLVWIAANGPIPDGLEVNHIDENKGNNRLSNLELKTHKENLLHSRHKFVAREERKRAAKMNNI